jgi:threonyl-tRNA synthetase
MNKIPFMLIVGEEEEQESSLSVRRHGGEDLGKLSLAQFADLVEREISSTLKSF